MCEYCEDRKYMLNQNLNEKMKLVVSTHEKTLGIRIASTDLDVYVDLKSKFCPMCGRNLKEQANEL